MRPVDDKGNEWAADTAAMAFEDTRQRCRQEMHDAEEKKSGGRLNAENGYSPATMVAGKGGDGATFVIDPILALLKHGGDDLNLLLQRRWGVFCSEAQDETRYVAKRQTMTRDAKIQRMIDNGEAVEQDLENLALADSVIVGAGGTVHLMEDPPPDGRSRDGGGKFTRSTPLVATAELPTG